MSIENRTLLEKWKPVLEHEELESIGDSARRNAVAQMLENTASSLSEDSTGTQSSILSEAPTNTVGNGQVQNYDPVMISLVRRAMPNLIAFDVAGVQPMTGPTGLIFAMRSKYAVDPANTATWQEAFYNEADTDFSGTGTHAGGTGTGATANTGVGFDTATAETLGDGTGPEFGQMAFEIDKVAVTAKSRALKAEYSVEIAQDLKAIHNLDAEKELANMLTSEILAEMNRELVRTIYNTAVVGSQSGVATAGTFDLDVDSDGRWAGEKFKGLLFQIEREANAVAKQTRRGKGNILICSSDVASALSMAGALDYTPAISNKLNVDDTGVTFAGTLGGRMKVYIDPYAAADYMIVGYKGSNAWDAGLFYCPYVPLQMARAIGENDFQPRLGFKTRYGLVANPFSRGATASDGTLINNTNVYYRNSKVTNIL